jgi:hypothetical protein
MAQFGGSTPTFQASDAAVAYGVATPTRADVNAVLNANDVIAADFAKSPTYFALGELVGDGVTSVDLTLSNTDNMTFLNTGSMTGTQAQAFFTDDAIDNILALSNTGVETFILTMTVSTDVANSGFYGGFIIGNSREGKAAVVPSTARFTEAMASRGPACDDGMAGTHANVRESPLLALPGRLAIA